MLAPTNRPVSVETAEARTTRGHKRPLAVLITGLVLALGIVAGTASTASADIGVIGGSSITTFTYSYSPEEKRIEVSCNNYNGSIQIRPYTAVQAGFLNGQYLTYRYQVKNRATGWWSQSGWTGAILGAGSGVNYTYPLNPLPVSSYRPGIRADWEVLVQVGYWNRGQWLYAPWQLPTSGFSSGGSASSIHCYT